MKLLKDDNSGDIKVLAKDAWSSFRKKNVPQRLVWVLYILALIYQFFAPSDRILGFLTYPSRRANVFVVSFFGIFIVLALDGLFSKFSD